MMYYKKQLYLTREELDYMNDYNRQSRYIKLKNKKVIFSKNNIALYNYKDVLDLINELYQDAINVVLDSRIIDERYKILYLDYIPFADRMCLYEFIIKYSKMNMLINTSAL